MTTHALDLRVTVLGADARGTETIRLSQGDDGAYHCQLRALPGASWLHFVLADGEMRLFCCEIAVDGSETVAISLRPDAAGWRIDVGNRDLLVLPARTPLPPLPIPIPVTDRDDAQASTQAVIVLDGTLRRFRKGPDALWSSTPLLGDKDAWPPIAKVLTGLMDALAARDLHLRWSILAFGDQEIPGVGAAGLRPEYRLRYPHAGPRIKLQPYNSAALRDALDDLARHPSPGGDFVDALADALFACRSLDWRPGPKLVVVVGDSPGYSILHPLDPVGNACARCLDVDSEALALHELGVELATIYLPPPAEALEAMEPRARRLVADAERQYWRLASSASHAAGLDGLDPAQWVEQLLGREFALARGACLGIADQTPG